MPYPESSLRESMGDVLLVGGTFFLKGKLVLDAEVSIPVEAQVRINSRGISFPRVQLSEDLRKAQAERGIQRIDVIEHLLLVSSKELDYRALAGDLARFTEEVRDHLYVKQDYDRVRDAATVLLSRPEVKTLLKNKKL